MTRSNSWFRSRRRSSARVLQNSRSRSRRLFLEQLENRALLAAIAPPNGIVSWWTGDGTPFDQTNNNNAALFNGAGFAGGKVGPGFNFDGNNDNLQAGTVGLPTGSADRTIELWARIDQRVAGEETLFASYGTPGTSTAAYTLGTDSGGRLFVSTWGPAIAGGILQDGVWHHVAATNAGTSFKLYLDGAQVAAGAMPVATSSGSTFWMGRQTAGALGNTRRLDGMVDEVSVYNRALSGGEINAIYLAGTDGKIKDPDYFFADFPSVVEGPASSTTNVTFTIGRFGSFDSATVNWTTADGTGTAGVDYVAQSGQYVFPVAEFETTVQVTVNGNNTPEANKTFNLVLSTPTPGFGVRDGQATIVNDDGIPPVGDITGSVFGDSNANGQWDGLLGEVGAANQFVYLDANSNGAHDTGELSTLTSGTGTYTFPGLTNGAYSVRLLLDPVTDETVPTVNAGPNLFAALPNIVDHVFDPTTGIDYATTSAGNVERFDTRTGKLLTPFKVGVSPGGLDITPDGQFLYVAEQQPGTTQSFVRKVNVQTGAVTNLGFDRVGAESGSFDITILNNGKALFSTQQGGGVRVSLREISLATDTILIRTDLVGAGTVAPFTRLNRNADRSAAVLTEPDAAGNVFFYKSASNTFTARLTLNTGLFLAPAAISRDGNRAAVAMTGGVRIINTNTAIPTIVRTVAPTQLGGLVFDPYRDVLYVGNDASDSLVPFAYSATDVFTAQPSISIGENVTGSARYFQLQISPNGKLLTLGTATGVRSYPLYAQTSRLVNVAGAPLVVGDFGVHTFPNVVATGTHDYYVMGNTATTLTVTAANGVIPNDRDPNLTQSLTARLVQQASRGFVSLNPDGSFVYTTSALMDRKDTFDYVINDGIEDSAPITATIARVANLGSSISGREFLDTNLNGIYDNVDSPIANARVYLDLNNNGFWDPPTDPFLFTSADGTWSFNGIAAGTYNVRTETPAGVQPTWPIAPVDNGLLLQIPGVKDFIFDYLKDILYIATSSGTILRYSVLTNQYLAPVTVPGIPSAMAFGQFNRFIFVADSLEVNDVSLIHRIDTRDGSVTSLSFDTPGAETAPVSIAFASNTKGFVTTGRSAAGFNPLHEINISGGIFGVPTISTRTVSIGSGPGGTIAPGTLVTGGVLGDPRFDPNVFFQEGGASGHLFQYDPHADIFIDGPFTQGSIAGTQTDLTYNSSLVASNQFGPSVYDASYSVREIFPNVFSGGVVFNPFSPLLYAVDAGPDVLIGYETNTFKEMFRVNVGEDIASAPLKKVIVPPFAYTSTLAIATPSGIRLFDYGLPGAHRVTVGEDATVADIPFGQRQIPHALTLDIPGGVMSEDQGANALTGILTRRGPDLSSDLYVQLFGVDPSRVDLPNTVLIPAGQSTVTFPIGAIDNNILDSIPTYIIIAQTQVSPLFQVEAYIHVNDRETLAVTINDATIPEVGGTTTATVTRSNSNALSPLVVTLTSSDTSEATVPATVTIPADQQSVSFTITAVDDAIFDGTRPVVISSAAAGYASLNASVGVVSDLDSYRNILVSTVPTLGNSRLRTFSPAGAQLSDVFIPVAPGGDLPVRDLIVNAAGNVEFYNGTGEPSLSTLDPRRGTYTHRSTAGWSTVNVSSYGGLATLGNFIFATDMASGTGADLQQGLIRFDITDYSSTRFATTLDFIDVAAGQDGLIYGMEFTPVALPAVPSPPYNVWVYNPTTLAFIRTVALASPKLPLAIAVNPLGIIYAVVGDNLIYEFSATGALLRTLSTGGSNLNDLDISPAGQLIAGGATGSVVVMNDPGHDLPSTFQVGNTQAFVAFGNLNRADGLTLSVAPTTFSEAAGPAASAATVTRPSLADLSISLVVTLASSDPTEADVQQTVTIPAFQATATFNILAIDDTLGDFTQFATLTALAPGQIGAAANLTVLDDEIDYFTVSILPTTMPEVGGSATGTVTRFVLDNSLPIIVTLASNDATEATVPATVTILANQNSATFPITAVDDAIRDATQNPIIAASAAGMSSGTASIAVTDDEIDNIALGIAPGVISENGGAATGTVTRFVGNNTVPMVVTFSSNDTTEATVPASVTILAGQNSATFTVTGVNDSLRDFNQSVIVTASAAGVVNATANVTVNDDELDTLAFSLATNFMMENGGSTLSVTVTRTVFDNSLPQVVNLLSSDTTEATVPATVTILGGDNSATFNITAVDDAIAIGDGPQTVTISGTAASFTPATADIIVGDNERPYQNQRNILDVDVSGAVVALDSLKIINLLNGIGSGDAATIMASYVGPPIFPDTNGDNSITPNDVLLVINYLNIQPPPGGEGEGEARTARVLSPAAIVAPFVPSAASPVASPAAAQPAFHRATDLAVLAIVGESEQRTALDDAPRGKKRHGEWDELVGDLATSRVKRRRG